MPKSGKKQKELPPPKLTEGYLARPPTTTGFAVTGDPAKLRGVAERATAAEGVTEITVQYRGAPVTVRTNDPRVVNEVLDRILPQPMNPLNLYREAVKAVPAARYALGVVGIAGAVAIVGAAKIDARAVFIAFLLMIVAMVLLLLFARLTTVVAAILILPLKVFVWSFLILGIASAVFAVSSVFFDKPKPFHELFGSDPVPRPAITAIDPAVEREARTNLDWIFGDRGAAARYADARRTGMTRYAASLEAQAHSVTAQASIKNWGEPAVETYLTSNGH
jgi:hypothetical protein